MWRNWLAHWTVDPGVAGSSPVDPANLKSDSGLTRGVTVAQQILILLVGVRIPAGQPKELQHQIEPPFRFKLAQIRWVFCEIFHFSHVWRFVSEESVRTQSVVDVNVPGDCL